MTLKITLDQVPRERLLRLLLRAYESDHASDCPLCGWWIWGDLDDDTYWERCTCWQKEMHELIDDELQIGCVCDECLDLYFRSGEVDPKHAELNEP